MISLIKVAFDCVTSSSSYRGQKKWRMSFPFNFLCLIFLGKDFTNSHFRIERSKQHINRAIGSTQTLVPIARCAWIDRCGRTWRSTDTPNSFSDFFYTSVLFHMHVKRYTRALISSLHRLWLTRTKAHRAAEALVHESSDTSGTLSRALKEVATRLLRNKNALITHVNIFFLKICSLGGNSLQKFSN